MDRIRIGVIGCGAIAQIMHIPYLRELSDRFEIAGISDVSPRILQEVGDFYGIRRRYLDYRELIADDLDAVIILTGWNHSEPAIAAAQAGKHVLVEKPMCISPEEADEMIAASEQNGVTLMVAYMKRYDPGYVYGQELVKGIRDPRYIQLNVFAGRNAFFEGHHLVRKYDDVSPQVLQQNKGSAAARFAQVLGPSPSELRLRGYQMLLGGTVHEVTILRGLFGSPEEVLAADTWAGGSAVTALMRYPGDLRCTLTHATMPDLKQYTEDLTVYGPDQSVSIQFPSPYLKNTPTWVVSRGMDDGRYWEKRILVSYEESFKEELKHFHDCVVHNLQPRTDGREAKKDIELLVRIARAFSTA